MTACVWPASPMQSRTRKRQVPVGKGLKCEAGSVAETAEAAIPMGGNR